jgi:hypothetical protein
LISKKEAEKAANKWKSNKHTFAQDPGVKKNIFYEPGLGEAELPYKHGKDYAEYSDAPGWHSKGRTPLSAEDYKFIWLRFEVKIVAKGTDGKSIIAKFWRSQQAVSKDGKWVLRKSWGPTPELPKTWKK